MLTFNNNHIFTGQIKEVLSTFNLPKYRIYTKEQQRYHDYAIAWNDAHPTEKIATEKDIIPTVKKTIVGYPEGLQYAPYIKNGTIQYCLYNSSTGAYTWEDSKIVYSYDFEVPNWTKTLKINNLIYDSHTHEYLGDYLRFMRDYDGVNLMSLYNCFSDRLCLKLKYEWTIPGTVTKYSFSAADKGYKYYMVPVKLFRNYTIAIDCPTEVEMFCGIYGKYQSPETKYDAIPALTYKKFNKMIFGKPELYSLLNELTEWSSQLKSDVAMHEQDLKLFIKLPVDNDSTVVILEGNYLNYNDSSLKFVTETGKNKKLVRTQNYTENNFDINAIADTIEGSSYSTHQDFSMMRLVTPLQLLRMNTKQQHPFADRLVEYLTDNVITRNEEILDNVRRVQKVITMNNEHADGGKVLLDTLVPTTPGVWEDSIRAIVYDKFNKTISANNNDTNHDILGYVDKDIEKCYRANTGKTDERGKPVYITISGVDLYTAPNGLYSDLGEDDE